MSTVKDVSDEERFAPFVRVDKNPGAYEKSKMFLGALTILPVRLVLIAVLLTSYFLIMNLIILLARDSNFLAYNVVARRFTQVSARLLLFLCGFYYIKERKPRGGLDLSVPLIVSNHVSFMEIIYLLSTPYVPAFVMKQACARLPIIGFIATSLLNGIDIDHKVRGKKSSDLIVDRMQDMHKHPGKYRPLVIFAEGTTSNGEYILSFRTGAFVPGVPLVPIYFRYPFKHYSCAFESISTPVFFFRLLTQFYNTLEVDYLDTYVPNTEEKQDPTLYAQNVREAICNASKGYLKKSQSGYKDKLDYHTAMRKEYSKLADLGYRMPYTFVTQPHVALAANNKKN